MAYFFTLISRQFLGMPLGGFRPFDANWWYFDVLLMFLFRLTSEHQKYLHNALQNSLFVLQWLLDLTYQTQ